jgi:large subunit ribosomal protein L18
MPATAKIVRQRRERRHHSLRRRLRGTAERPRFNVFRSSANVFVQLIDDDLGTTLVAASSIEKSVKGKKIEQSRAVGELAAQRAKEKGITRVVFDRGGYIFHGRVKAVADGARAGGLEF